MVRVMYFKLRFTNYDLRITIMDFDAFHFLQIVITCSGFAPTGQVEVVLILCYQPLAPMGQ